MDVRLLSHRPADGWSTPLPAELDSPNTLVIAFAATDYARRGDVWDELAGAFPTSCHIGASSAGEILADAVDDDTLALAVVRFDRATLVRATTPIQAVEVSRSTGAKIGRALAPHAPRLVLVLSEGLHVNGSELASGLADGLPPGTVVAGGLAGDGDRFAHTWTLVDGLPRGGWVSAVGICGPVSTDTASESGWLPFGPEREVTRAEGSVLGALDGKPALALYKEYLGKLSAGLPAAALHYPLSIRPAGCDGPAVVRTILAVDERTQSMTFAGDIPQGSRARLMRSNRDRLIEGAASAGRRAAASATEPVLAIAVSCVGRKLVLGQRVDEEVAAARAALPPGSSVIGFYSYGEIAPSGSSACELHNQTMTLATIRESDA